jgi:hypothetical protein
MRKFVMYKIKILAIAIAVGVATELIMRALGLGEPYLNGWLATSAFFLFFQTKLLADC